MSKMPFTQASSSASPASSGEGREQGMLRITWIKSAIGYSQRQKKTIRALGLHRLNDVVEQADTPAIRGMLTKVSHLVRVEEVEQR
jgi:large subunit ribosomal protein L30